MTTFTTEDRIEATKPPKRPKEGSKWGGSDDTVFHVIHVVEVDGHTWVHYEQDKINESKEFSCYLESFLQRFRELPDDQTKRLR